MQTDGQKDMNDDVDTNAGQAEEKKETPKAGDNDAKTSRKMKRKEKEVDVLKKEIADLKDKHLRLQAEFDNYRKRSLKDRMELTRTAGEELLVKLLPIFDDFDRALAHIEKADTIVGLKEGVALIAGKFGDFMKQNGIVEIDAKGQVFDTDLHEAVSQFQAGEENKGKIIDVAEKGYKLHEKVVRYSKVIVGV